MYFYSGIFANQRLNIAFKYPDTFLYFHEFLSIIQDVKDDPFIQVNDNDYLLWEEKYKVKKSSFVEYNLSAFRISDQLLHYNAVIFHGASFLFNDKAYILSAPSGTGKTTQIRNLITIWQNDIQIINGDKSIIKWDSDNTIPTVYPSPWMGKEGWGSNTLSAPLGGIIFLKQGESNYIKEVNKLIFNEYYLSAVFTTFENKQEINKICQMGTSLFTTVPVWMLVNKGDLDSTKYIQKLLLGDED